MILVIGGSGYIGSALCRRLVAEGAEVVGVSRSEAGATSIRAAGARAVFGSLENSHVLYPLARRARVVINAAPHVREAESIVAGLIRAMVSGMFVHTSGTGVIAKLSSGEPDEDIFEEDTPFTPPPGLESRASVERVVLFESTSAVRGVVVRPPLIYGYGGSVQIPMLARTAKTGRVRYVGRGLNRWSFVHLDDLINLYVLVLTSSVTMSIFHAVAGEADFKSIAEAVANSLGIGTASWSPDEAESSGGYGRHGSRVVIGSNSRSLSRQTERALGWRPTRNDLLEDIRIGSYKALQRVP